MKLYGIDKFTSKKDVIDVVHYLLFHGYSVPSALRPVLTPSNTLGLIRSGKVVPQIFIPDLNFIVQEEQLKLIESIPGVSAIEVRPVKLINYWVDAFDFSFYERADFLRNPYKYSPQDILDWMPNDLSLFDAFPQCYKLGATKVRTLDIPNPINIQFTRNDGLGSQVTLQINSDIIDRHPIIWSSIFFLREDVYNIYNKYIDSNYFDVYEVNI